MIPDPDPATIGVGAVVAVFVAARLHASDRWWCPELAWFWWPLRRLVWPVFDHALESVSTTLPLELYAKTVVREDEVVATLDLTLEELHADLAAAGYEAQPLASLAKAAFETDAVDAGDVERSSLARYYGAKPFGYGPEWLRRRQVHVRPFGEDGALTITAHAEANPYRPDLALAHLLGHGLDAEEGVRMVADDLEIHT